MRKTPQLLVIVGPTASGKSAFGVRLARSLPRVDGEIGAEIVSADSRQVYEGLDIGTGKITRREMRGVRHHLLDVADPRRQFSAEKYRVLAHTAIADIVSRGKTPIICGGSGFYIDAILNDQPFPDVPPDMKLRRRLKNTTATKLLAILRRLDMKRAQAISQNSSEKNNRVRLIRAIEIAAASKKASGKTLAKRPDKDKAARGKKNTRHETTIIGLKVSPAELKKKIRARIEKRLKQGMIAEARRLHMPPPRGIGLSWKRMDELGLEYRYLARYLQGKMSKDELTEKLATEIWHYAKRQMTWFKRNKKIRFIDNT